MCARVVARSNTRAHAGGVMCMPRGVIICVRTNARKHARTHAPVSNWYKYLWRKSSPSKNMFLAMRPSSSARKFISASPSRRSRPSQIVTMMLQANLLDAALMRAASLRPAYAHIQHPRPPHKAVRPQGCHPRTHTFIRVVGRAYPQRVQQCCCGNYPTPDEPRQEVVCRLRHPSSHPLPS